MISPLARHGLHLIAHVAHLVSILLIGGSNDQRQQVAVSTAMRVLGL